MTTQKLYDVIQQNTLNDIIVKTIQKHHPKIGEYVGEDQDGNTSLELPEAIADSMNQLANEISQTVLALNKIFVSKNVTAVSAEEYLHFLCDLLPTYILAPVSSISNEEVEAAVIFQVENTTVDSMREAITTHNFAAQVTEEKISLEHIKSQIDDIDDGTIKEVYKTMLLTQLKVEKQ